MTSAAETRMPRDDASGLALVVTTVWGKDLG